MNILITGGAGYLGTELANSLVKDDQVAQVVVYDNLSRENYNLFLGHKREGHHKIKFINGDILDSRTFKKSLENIDVVYHLAAKVTTPFANIDSHFYEQVNHWGTAEVAYALEKSKVGKVVYTSSLGVYGGGGTKVTANTTPNPRTFYGTSKLRGEGHISRLQDKMATCIVRCGNIYGYSKSMRFDSVINRFAFEANFNGRISINGNGKQVRAFIHIDRAANYLHQMLHKDIPSGVYNLMERNVQILDIVDVYKELLPTLEFIFINQHLTLRTIKVELDERIAKFLDTTPEKPLKEDLANFLERFAF